MRAASTGLLTAPTVEAIPDPNQKGTGRLTNFLQALEIIGSATDFGECNIEFQQFPAPEKKRME